MQSNPFDCPERNQLFRKIGPTWYNLCPISAESGLPVVDQQVPYALYHCHSVSRQTVQEIQYATELVGRIFSRIWPIVRSLDEETLMYYGFPVETIRVTKRDTLAPFCMRLDWCWNENSGTKKIIEANTQTPSFWWECTEGNSKVAQHFQLEDPAPRSQTILTQCLNLHIKRAASWLNKAPEACQVAFTALNNLEDMGTMNWLSKHCHLPSNIFPLEWLGIQDGSHLFNAQTGQPIDILFMWYPIEWALHDVDEGGQKLWTALEELILTHKVVLVNFASAFALQPKSILAFISDLGYDCFDAEEAGVIFDYFPKTSLKMEDLGPSYFAKPILGRQGEGGFAVQSGQIAAKSRSNAPWYTEQPYVYQELLDFPTLEIGGKSMSVLWGSWLYNDGSDKFIAGGQGMRVSEGSITDDFSYWCPVGFSNSLVHGQCNKK